VPLLLFPLALRFLEVWVLSLLWSSLSLGWNEICYHSESVLTLQVPSAKNFNLYKTAKLDNLWHLLAVYLNYVVKKYLEGSFGVLMNFSYILFSTEFCSAFTWHCRI
jgi:hypothetical protein